VLRPPFRASLGSSLRGEYWEHNAVAVQPYPLESYSLVANGANEMTDRLKNNVEQLSRNMKKNAPAIGRKLEKAGVHTNEMVILSIAKYYPALKKLAAE
jgi:hypothetical protein